MKGIAFGLACAAAVIGGGFYYMTQLSPTAQAREACRARVLERIASPSTATFARLELINDEVFFDVDAQNGFGAERRASGYCQLHMDAAGDVDPATAIVASINSR